MKKIYLGSDHAGFKLKNSIKKYLLALGYQCKDLGNLIFQKEDDYPDYAELVAKRVAVEKTKGILICGSAHGMCIAANKIKGIRAVAANNLLEAKKTREHNDANILCLSGWYTKESDAKKIVKIWLETKYIPIKKHKRRLKKIKKLEK